jgi:hypothetical protein
MCMIDNEDSVVTSLNELRKLKHERITRQTHSRAVVGSGRVAALAEDPASEQLTPPPMQVSGLSLVGGQPSYSPRPNGGFAVAPQGGFGQPAQGYDHYPVQAPPVIHTKTSYGAAVVMSVLLIGGGAAGYMKLQNDTQAVLVAKDASLRQAEEARSKAVEQASRVEMLSRTNLRQCEDKLKATLAVAPAAAVAPSPTSPAVDAVGRKAEKPAPAAKVVAHASHKAAAHSARRTAQAESAEPKTGDIPTIAKKKKLDNDPLAGLGKL